MRKIAFLSLLIFCLGFSVNIPGGGADQVDFPDIYIDADAGDGGVGSQADPYNELSDINWTTGGDNSIHDYINGTPSADAIVHLDNGTEGNPDMWREQSTVAASGIAAYRVKVTSYDAGGEGNTDKPIINGADLVTGFTKTVVSTTGNTSGTATAANTITLTTWTPVAGETCLIGIAAFGFGYTVNSVAGNNLTWTQVATVDNVQATHQEFVWKGVGVAPTAGTIIVTFSGSPAASSAMAVRFWGIDGTTPVEVTETDAGPAIDNDDMKDDITTLTDGAWAVGLGSHRTATFTAPGGETQIGSTVSAGAGGQITTMSIWYESVATAGLTTVGADADLSGAIDWTQITVSLKPIATYDATLASTTYCVIEDEEFLTKKTLLSGITAVGQWYYDSTGTKLYVRSSDDTDPDTHVIEACVRQSGIYIFGYSYITVDDIAFEKQQFGSGDPLGKDLGGGVRIKRGDGDPATYQGYIIQNCSFDKQASIAIVVNNTSASVTRQITNVTIQNNIVGEFNWGRIQGVSSIWISGTGATGPAPTNVNILNNTITQNLTLNPDNDDAHSAEGITFLSGGGTNVISGNTISGTSHGMQVEAIDSSTAIGTIKQNYIHDTGDDGLWLKDNFSSVSVYYNIFDTNGDDNIDTHKEAGGDSSSNANIYNNVLAYATNYAFHLRRTSVCNFKNNIILQSDDNANRIAIKLDDEATDTSLATLDSNYNRFYHSSGAINIDIISTSLTATRTLAQWVSNESQDTHSTEGAPLVTDPADGDFTLQADSLCINTGTPVGLTQDCVGATVPRGGAVDIGGYEYQYAEGLIMDVIRNVLIMPIKQVIIN